MSSPLIRIRNAGASIWLPIISNSFSKILLVAAFFTAALQTPAFAANHYINAAATGTNDGSSWTNAFPTFAAAITAGMVRGDTYYVAGGTYNEGPYINVPLNGTLWIYIVKADPSTNGSDPGWNPAYATTVATVNSFDLDKGYVSIDGVTGSGTTGHGIHVLNPSTSANADGILLENGKRPFSIKH